MFTLLATIISLYCVMRLIEMSNHSSAKNEGKITISSFMYFISAMFIAIMCMLIWMKSDEVSQLFESPKPKFDFAGHNR